RIQKPIDRPRQFAQSRYSAAAPPRAVYPKYFDAKVDQGWSIGSPLFNCDPICKVTELDGRSSFVRDRNGRRGRDPSISRFAAAEWSRAMNFGRVITGCLGIGAGILAFGCSSKGGSTFNDGLLQGASGSAGASVISGGAGQGGGSGAGTGGTGAGAD